MCHANLHTYSWINADLDPRGGSGISEVSYLVRTTLFPSALPFPSRALCCLPWWCSSCFLQRMPFFSHLMIEHHIHSVAHYGNLITHADMWIWLPAWCVTRYSPPPPSPMLYPSTKYFGMHTWYMQELTLTSKVPCILRILCMVLESNVGGT